MIVNLQIFNLQPPEFLLDPRPRGIRDLLLDVPSVIDQVFQYIDIIVKVWMLYVAKKYFCTRALRMYKYSLRSFRSSYHHFNSPHPR